MDVRVAPLDRVGGTPGPRHDPLHHRPAVDARLDHDQILDVAGAAVLGVAQGAFEHGLKQAGALVGQKAQQFEGLFGRLAADERGKGPDLPGRHVREAVHRRVTHTSSPSTRRADVAVCPEPPYFLDEPRPPEWPLKSRVGANSPSLWPTMSSVTYRRIKVRPLWTRKVAPTNSGTMVQSRAHVLIGSRWLVRWALSTLASRRSSTCGPFFSERLIAHPVPETEGSILGRPRGPSRDPVEFSHFWT